MLRHDLPVPSLAAMRMRSAPNSRPGRLVIRSSYIDQLDAQRVKMCGWTMPMSFFRFKPYAEFDEFGPFRQSDLG